MYTRDLRHRIVGHFLSFSTEQWSLPQEPACENAFSPFCVPTPLLIEIFTLSWIMYSSTNLFELNHQHYFLIHNLFIVSTCGSSKSREHRLVATTNYVACQVTMQQTSPWSPTSKTLLPSLSPPHPVPLLSSSTGIRAIRSQKRFKFRR